MMRSRQPLSVLALLFLVSSLLFFPGAVADHGPLPTGSATLQAIEVTGSNAQETAQVADAFRLHAQGQLADAVELMQADLQEGKVTLPMNQVDSVLEHGWAGAETTWGLTVASLMAMSDAGSDQNAELVGFQQLMTESTSNMLGIMVPGEDGHPISAPGPEPCVAEDLQATLDALPPGGELRVCPGTIELDEPLVVRQHFVTLRSVQGPGSVTLQAAGGHGVIVTGSGVNIEGLRITGATGPGAAAIHVGDPSGEHALEQYYVTIRDNILQRNANGVIVQEAQSVLLSGNTIRDSMPTGPVADGNGVVVEASTMDGAATAGVLLVANNLLNNARHAALGSGAHDVPVLAVFNHYGDAAGPNIRIGPDLCLGPSSDRCRNAVGSGVVPVGFSPVPL